MWIKLKSWLFIRKVYQNGSYIVHLSYHWVGWRFTKNNCHDLSIMAKTVGSNFFLKDRRLSASFKKGGFDALAAQARAPSATSRPLSSLYWLALVDDFRKANWPEIIKYPELVYQKSQQYLQYYSSN